MLSEKTQEATLKALLDSFELLTACLPAMEDESVGDKADSRDFVDLELLCDAVQAKIIRFGVRWEKQDFVRKNFDEGLDPVTLR